jgi:hypothetical protein
MTALERIATFRSRLGAMEGADNISERVKLARSCARAHGERAQHHLNDEDIGCDKGNPLSLTSSFPAQEKSIVACRRAYHLAQGSDDESTGGCGTMT